MSRKQYCWIVCGVLVVSAGGLMLATRFAPSAVRRRKLRAELTAAVKQPWERQERLRRIYGRYRPEEVATAFLELMASPDPELRGYAVSVPGWLDDNELPWEWPRVRQQVKELLEDPNVRVRREAALAIWHNWPPNKRPWEQFREMLSDMAGKDPAPVCRATAGYVLARMGQRTGLKSIIDNLTRLRDPAHVSDCLAWLELVVEAGARGDIDYGDLNDLVRSGVTSDSRLGSEAEKIARPWLQWYQTHKKKLHYDPSRLAWGLESSKSAGN